MLTGIPRLLTGLYFVEPVREFKCYTVKHFSEETHANKEDVLLSFIIK